MTGCGDDIEALSRFNKPLIDSLLTAAKDPASSAKNVRRKARTRDGITQRNRAQYRTDRIALAVDATGKDSVAEINEDILPRLIGIDHPALNPHTNVPH